MVLAGDKRGKETYARYGLDGKGGEMGRSRGIPCEQMIQDGVWEGVGRRQQPHTQTKRKKNRRRPLT
jgi:hypothetical protein